MKLLAPLVQVMVGAIFNHAKNGGKFHFHFNFYVMPQLLPV
jgi:hypothetical protein